MTRDKVLPFSDPSSASIGGDDKPCPSLLRSLLRHLPGQRRSIQDPAETNTNINIDTRERATWDRSTSAPPAGRRYDWHQSPWLVSIMSMLLMRRVRRSVLGCAAVFMLVYMAAEYYMLAPTIQEYPMIIEPLDLNILGALSDWAVPNKRPEFTDFLTMETLDPALLPDHKPNRFSFRHRRLIFIGDVHGCFEELEELLDKISLAGGDHLIFTGDMIGKGPESGKVVDLAQELGASCVRGNHEDRILLVRLDLKSRDILDSESVNEYDLPQYDHHDRQLSRSLTDDQAAWLQACPVILKIGHLKDMGDIVVVHDGLYPGVPLTGQELTSVMSMPTKVKKGVPWFKIYNQFNMLLTLGPIEPAPSYTELTTVIYGGQSFDMRQFTRGLNSGCVEGGELSALIIEDGGNSRVVQVKCKEYVEP